MAETSLFNQQRELVGQLADLVTRNRQATAAATEALQRERAGAEAALGQVSREASQLLEKVRGLYNNRQGMLDKKQVYLVSQEGVVAQREQTLDALRQCAQVAADTVAAVPPPKKKPQGLLKEIITFFIVYSGIVVLGPICGTAYYISLMIAGGDEAATYKIMAVLLVGLAVAGWWVWEQGRRKLRAQYLPLVQALVDAEHIHRGVVAQAQADHQRRVAAAEAEYQRTAHANQQEFTAGLARLSAAFADIAAEAERISPAWSSRVWHAWRELPQAPPTALRLGVLQADTGKEPLSFPALLPFPGGQALVIEAGGEARPSAIVAMQSLMARALAHTPPGKLRFTFIDPIGLGQNVAPFMHLADDDSKLVTGKAWTEPGHIEQRLAELTEHMENVIQKYLRNSFATIDDYNRQAGEVAEAYRVLVVFDFPVNFSDTAARRLVSIVQNGPRCGVYAVVLVDPDKPRPYGFDLADLERSAHVIAAQDDHFVWVEGQLSYARLFLDGPPDLAMGKHLDDTLFGRIIKAAREGARAAERVEVPFSRLFALFNAQREKYKHDYPGLQAAIVADDPATWWQASSQDDLIAPMGRAGAANVQSLALGKGMALHTLVVGKTGSGKSTLLHAIITSIAMMYSPAEVELYLVDFKQGIEFKTYAGWLPHARVIAIQSDREFGMSVLQQLEAELNRRGDVLRQATEQTGTKIQDIADYRRTTGQRMPRILLLVDEFQIFFTEDDTVSAHAARILDLLVRQGRSAGIHVLLGSQTLAGSYSLARSTIDQMAVRIALQCSESDSRLILADDNPEARLLTRPGEAIYNASNGMVAGNSRFQVAWLPDDQREIYLKQLKQLAHDRQIALPQTVFEGNAPGDVKPLLVGIMKSPQLQRQPVAPPSRATLWIGQSVMTAKPLTTALRRQSASNLLIVGQDERAAQALFALSAFGLAAQLPANANGYWPDGLSPVVMLDFGTGEQPRVAYFDALANHLSVMRVGRRRDLPAIIEQVSAEVQRRLAADAAAPSPIYLFVYGLHRARDLRQDEGFGFSSFGEPAAAGPAQQFTTLLREGPEVGIHTLIWCDTVANLGRVFERRLWREFAMRVAFQMSTDDSANLIDSPYAGKLGPHRAIFYHEDEGRVEKFRPYSLVDDAWLAKIGVYLRSRPGAQARLPAGKP